jgi:hypothetical protein
VVVFLNGAPPGYKFEVTADLSRIETRERLSQPAMDGFFAIVEKWEIPMDVAAELLGGVPRSTLYKGKTAAGTLSLDQLTRISYIVGIYKSLHILRPDDLADQWISQPNDHFLFQGQPPLAIALRDGILGLQQVRSLLDQERGGH